MSNANDGGMRRVEPELPISTSTRKFATVLVITTVHWACTTRLCLAMAERGFRVVAVAPRDHAVHGMVAIISQTIGRTRAAWLRAAASAIDEFVPDLVIPGDEGAIALLRQLHSSASRGAGHRARDVALLLESSLGPPASFAFSHHRHRFVALAEEEGLSVPAAVVLHGIGDLKRQMEKSRFPFVLKRDESYGGLGVRIVANASEAFAAFRELQSQASRVAAVKHAIKKLDYGFLRHVWQSPPAIALQQYVEGRPANRAVMCWQGEVLAGLSVEVLQTINATGPATVVRRIESKEMAAAAARIVRRLNLSGFIGFDFVVETRSAHPYLIEMNARPTQICHFALDAATDMVGALSRQLSGQSVPAAASAVVGSRPIVLFPQEIWRDPASKYFRYAYHDMPVDAAFIAAYRNPVPTEPPSWVEAVRQYARRDRQWEPRASAPGQALRAAVHRETARTPLSQTEAL